MDKKITDILRSAEGMQPPAGLKEKILNSMLPALNDRELGWFEKLLYSSPLRAAGVFSVSLSAVLWAVFGSNYPALLISIFQ